MTASVQSLEFADAREAADLGAFLARLIHYDRAAAVRLQAGGGTGALAVFGRPASFEVLAIRTARLASVGQRPLDVTVSAGELLESIDEPTGTAVVPRAVTGPPWAGVLPPRGGWRRRAGLPGQETVRGALAAAVAEFRARDERLTPETRTRAERDRIGREIWSRTLGDTGLPLRAAHAAQSLGFLRPVRASVPAGVRMPTGAAPLDAAPPEEPLALLESGGWLRLRTPYGSIAVRVAGLGGLTVTPA
ncbi:hypothetical protein [Streptomyces corynorhini]|uniref:Uncharacterized protein n=1 Tax=Streptomyces corynorhini TaxID=2282652 RepID=A0A370B4G4_9ACTN|nr:hypothetical protein [Streptomyces corynorhini]RDG35279.1 hypothetical protein DVH02_26095 [Streptomyces corynorhini]